MNNAAKIDRLLKIKELRRQLAEVQLAKTANLRAQSQAAVELAWNNHEYIKVSSKEQREQRISQVINTPGNVPVDGARITNLYNSTKADIKNSKAWALTKVDELQNARALETEDRQKLARFLQVEERTRKLGERLAEQSRLNEQRQD
jgi:hypothetical protein